MKQKTLLLLITFMVAGLSTIIAQDLSKDIKGRWVVKKFQKDKKPELQGGTLEFLGDGMLLSEGIFFGTGKGTFTTDQDGSTLVIQNETGTTEWLASIKNDVLRLKSTGKTATPEKIYITLTRSNGSDTTMKNDL